MTFDWSSNDRCSVAATGALWLCVDTFDDGIAWAVSPRERRAFVVRGLVDDMESGKRAAEQIAERIRKGLKWAR